MKTRNSPPIAWPAASLGIVLMAGGAGLVAGAGELHARAGSTQGKPAQENPGEGVWRNYDFVPGATVWKATDFTTEPVGRFPATQVEFVRGNMQVVELEGEKAIEVSGASVFRLPLPQILLEGFTLEFMVNFPAPNFITTISFSPLSTAVASYPHDYVQIYSRPGIYRKGREVSNLSMPAITAKWVPVRLQVDGAYAILYVGSERAAMVPAANFARTNAIEVRASGNQRLKTYLKDFVVAVGINRLYDTLMKAGSFTTRGILFDTDSDRIRPESTPALADIQKALTDHTDFRIVIEGHTDSSGDAARNQALSERRAQAVARHLAQQGIAAARLTAEGKGATVPAADNATAEGRQQNRRVVIRLAK